MLWRWLFCVYPETSILFVLLIKEAEQDSRDTEYMPQKKTLKRSWMKKQRNEISKTSADPNVGMTDS